MASCVDSKGPQTDEIKALSSIYGDDFLTIVGDESAFELRICCDEEGWWSATVNVLLPATYPQADPPVLQIHTECLSQDELVHIECELQKIWTQSKGESILYIWLEKIRELLQDKYEMAKLFIEATDEEKKRESFITSAFREEDTDALHTVVDSDASTRECPDIYSGAPFTVKKSTFQGHVAQVYTVDEVKLVLRKLQENNKIANATHNIVAFRLAGVNASSFIQDYADDGEVQAGGRLLHLLQIMDVKNIVVVVSRWFGGVLLGPDRFRLISNAAREVVIAAGLFDPEASKGKPQKKTCSKMKRM